MDRVGMGLGKTRCHLLESPDEESGLQQAPGLGRRLLHWKWQETAWAAPAGWVGNMGGSRLASRLGLDSDEVTEAEDPEENCSEEAREIRNSGFEAPERPWKRCSMGS